VEGSLRNPSTPGGRYGREANPAPVYGGIQGAGVKRLLEGGRGLSEVATELGLSTGQLSTWRTELLAAGSAEALAARRAEEAEALRLRREVKRLEEENLILRKAAAVFAKGIA
jgi:transposase